MLVIILHLITGPINGLVIALILHVILDLTMISIVYPWPCPQFSESNPLPYNGLDPKPFPGYYLCL
jgi:hypothetical protein